MISPDSLIDDHRQVNFKAPNYLISNFDNFVRFKRVSRTSMLIHLMESYLRSETQQMKEDGQFNQLIQSIKQSSREDLKQQLKQDLSEIRDEWEPPMIPGSDDYELSQSWEDRLRYLK